MKKLALFLMVLFSFSPLHCLHTIKKFLSSTRITKAFNGVMIFLQVWKRFFTIILKFTINILYMDSKRVSSEEYYAKFQLYKLQLQNQKYDLIVAVDKFAYDFLIKYYHELFTDETILFTGLEQFNPEDIQKEGLDDRIYGILEKRAIRNHPYDFPYDTES